MVGNTANIKPASEYLLSLQKAVSQEKDSFTLLFMGDILDKNGMDDKSLSAKDSLRLKALIEIALLNPLGKTYFISGDRDWDNSGKDGLKNRKRLEDYIEDKLGKGFFQPGNGCPGPEPKQVNAHLTLIFIDSQWWIHPHKKPAENDATCQIATPEDFWEELEDIIETSDQQNILIVAHHPVFSNGPYGGKKLWKKHLFPFTDINPKAYFPLPALGSIYAAFRQNVGMPRDMAYYKYQAFRDEMENVLADHSPLIYASGHEYNTQVINVDNNYHINSGTATRTEPAAKSHQTVFREAEKGIVKLIYYSDGAVDMQVIATEGGTPEVHKELSLYRSACSDSTKDIAGNTTYIPCREVIKMASKMDPSFYDSTAIAIAGEEYKAGKFREAITGKHYRPSWILPVRVPYLNLDTAYGGLKPFAKGGGTQTLSLKFKGGDGREYVYRSVNKNPRKALPYDLRGTFIEDIIKDQTTTQHPYGALVVSKMLDATDIFHAQPTLYLLPDDPKLGPFQKDFGNLYGLMELRPKGPQNGVKGFKGADDVDRSFKFFRKVYDDNDVQLYAPTFAKARAFDIWIGDWGKHQENWKWAGFEKNGKGTYYPVPRDRDHAFSRWDGLFPWLADREWAKENVQNFGYKYQGIRSLTFQARHMDRFLLSEMDWNDFQKAIKELQTEITPEVIDSAIAQLPVEDQKVAGPELAAKLKARRETLPQAVREYYEYLAKYVDVKGSNKKEIFEIKRLPEGNVEVAVYDDKDGSKGDRFYHRTFLKSETKEIRIYGLGKDDHIYISGEAGNSILLRVIGGTGEDKIVDSSSVNGLCRETVIYDSSHKDTILQGHEARVLSPKDEVEYDRKDFEYNKYLVLPRLSYNRDNGFGVGVAALWTEQKFHKKPFARQHSLGFLVTTRQALALSYAGLYNQVLGKWDIELQGALDILSNGYPHFFGIGNETIKNDSLYRENYYRNTQNSIRLSPAIRRDFWQRSYISFGPVYEYSNVFRKTVNNIFLTNEVAGNSNFYGLEEQQFTGGTLALNVDLRDRPAFSQKGMQLFGRHTSYINIKGGNGNFGITEGFVAFYHTVRLGIPFTLALKGGGANSYGNTPFYKLPTLGQAANLRGYLRHRFAGASSAYFNSELRLQLGKIKRPLPLFYGIYGFYDLGRVWAKGETSDKLHHGYGAGFYLAPLVERISFTFSFAHSEEEKLLFQFGLGFFID
jgi:hypothetical protein